MNEYIVISKEGWGSGYYYIQNGEKMSSPSWGYWLPKWMKQKDNVAWKVLRVVKEGDRTKIVAREVPFKVYNQQIRYGSRFKVNEHMDCGYLSNYNTDLFEVNTICEVGGYSVKVYWNQEENKGDMEVPNEFIDYFNREVERIKNENATEDGELCYFRMTFTSLVMDGQDPDKLDFKNYTPSEIEYDVKRKSSYSGGYDHELGVPQGSYAEDAGIYGWDLDEETIRINRNDIRQMVKECIGRMLN